MPRVLIFQLGTNNWQRPKKDGSGELEFAPGSGVLHEAHHNAYNLLGGVKSYSMYPSKNQAQPTEADADYRVFELDHDIPICESASPNSSKRWHGMSDEEFTGYVRRLENEVYEYMKECEAKAGTNFTMCIAHHSFINPLVVRNVIQRRVKEGLPQCPLYCFVHGTALKMYRWELGPKETEEQKSFPMRFHKMIVEEKLFDDLENGVSACFVISKEQKDGIKEIFPSFPQDHVFVAPNGINVEKFRPREKTFSEVLVEQTRTILWPAAPSEEDCAKYERMVVFVGKAAEWKRQAALLHAMADLEKAFPNLALLCAGTGPEAELEKLKALCEGLGLRSTFLIGARGQDQLAEMYTVASLGCFPSFREPFGLVFVECMACKTPVIGANSGGPKDFVSPEVGMLVAEPPETTDLSTVADGVKTLGKTLAEAITTALNEDWKGTKGAACIKLAHDKFTVASQVKQMLNEVGALPKALPVPDVDWAAISKKLPCERTPEAFAKRNALFSQMDPNGNGYLSLAEIDMGVRDVLQIDEIFNAKPAIMRAFQKAKDYVPSNAGTPGADYVQHREFRIFLQFLRHYFELWVMFQSIDTEMDRRINLEEFSAAIPNLAKWGVLIEEGTEEATFGQIDGNDGGQVLFAEFCDWAIKQKLDLGEEKDDGDVPELSMTVEDRIKETFSQYDLNGDGVISSEELTSVLTSLNPKLKTLEIDQILAAADVNKDGKVDYKEFVDWLFKRRGGREGKATEATRKAMAAADVDWEAINAKLPYERTPEALAKRKELFNSFDPNGNGYLSLSEVDRGIRDVLQVDAIFNAKPAIMRAFQASKNAVPSAEGSPGEDYVQRKEFRILLQFLRHYFELWVMFKTIDSEGDRRINLEEFTAAVPQLKDWGLSIEDGSEESVFNSIDSNDGGQVLFVEFCTWAIKQKLDLGEEEEEEAAA